MKHKLMLLIAALTLFTHSCSTDTPESGDLPPAILADPAAAMETIVTFSEFAVTPASAFFLGAFAAIMAAEASGFLGRQTNANYSFGKTTDIALPYTKELSNNPFESIGKMHNIGLDYVNKKRDFTEWHNRFVNYDAATWMELMEVVSPGMSVADKQQLLAAAKQAKLVEKMQAKAIYTVGMTPQEAIGRLSLSTSGHAYINSVMNNCTEMRSSGKTALQMADYINGEIAARLNHKNVYSMEERGILTFLTVAKHSGYYWHN